MRIKELNQKAENLIEVGNELESRKYRLAAEKESAIMELASAYNELASASETDENGTPRGDVSSARMRVEIAKSSLEQIEREQQDCERQIETNRLEKTATVRDISDINSREEHNINVLKALQAKQFSQNANMVLADLISRMNSGEEMKDRLLASMGKESAGVRYSTESVNISSLKNAGALTVAPSETMSSNLESGRKDTFSQIKDAFYYAETFYDSGSVHYQEVANRYADSLNASLEKVRSDVNDRMRQLQQMQEIRNRYSAQGVSDASYRILQKKYYELEANRDELKAKEKQLLVELEKVNNTIDQSQKTTFKGFRGVSFGEAYDSMVTDHQGKAVDGFGGTCSICHGCTAVNQQTLHHLTEADGVYICTHTNPALCTTGKSYNENGGTKLVEREAFFKRFDLDFDVMYGKKDGGDITLEQIEKMMNDGWSAGLCLKAQDLQQPDLSDRSVITFTKKQLQSHYANHETTVVGFSYDANGVITGVWLNDTGNHTTSNRVFIDRAKFEKMQSNTYRFAAEFVRKKG